METPTPAQTATRVFLARFGRRPAWIASAPGRVNLIGEHVDYNGGAVLPMAIDRRTVVVGAPAAGDAGTVIAHDLGETWTTDPAGPTEAAPRWAATLGAVARELEGLGVAAPRVDAVVTSDVPIGGGLSSSAALAVAYATLLERAAGVTIDPLAKARSCQRAEQAASGVPCGIMDMLIATSARAGCAMLIECRSGAVTPIPLPPWPLLVVNTGVRHDLADTAYAQRRATCERIAAIVGAEDLCAADPSALDAARLSPVERRRAAHVVAEHARTLRAARALERDDLDELGRLLFESHDSLRDLYAVSCPELDTVVETGRRRRDRPGDVLGARLTGAGFGGCAIVLRAGAGDDGLAEAIRADFRAAHGRTPELLTVRAGRAAESASLCN